MRRTGLLLIFVFAASGLAIAQDSSTDGNRLNISGNLLTDQRFLLSNDHDWAWNENRLTLKLDKKISGQTKFYSEVWLRNIGLPQLYSSSDLYNKGIVDPYNLEIREAYVQMNGFLTKNLDLTIGRQRIVWGTGDRLNPTDILNPYDLEDILDFGRHRGSDAINANYYFGNNFSIQAIYIPFFQPANMPVGIFANALTPSMDLPQGMTLMSFSDTLLMPRNNIKESSTAAFKFKGYVRGLDFSVGYVWGYDGIPVSTMNTFTPYDLMGGVSIQSDLSFIRTHTVTADFVTSIAGIGFWGEAALTIPREDLIMSNDLSALFPLSPDPVILDTTLVDGPYVKFLVGADYFFREGSYLNIQFLHGFIQERGQKALNDYIFARYEKSFFNEKLKIAPVGGAFIVNDWNNLKDSYTLVYVPQISYRATPNVEITLSAAIFDGKGDNMFSMMNDYDMMMFHVSYDF